MVEQVGLGGLPCSTSGTFGDLRVWISTWPALAPRAAQVPGSIRFEGTSVTVSVLGFAQPAALTFG
ncbi:MAG: hypothetical protein ACT4P1_15590 [Sporichthyaceae bacterium]